MTLERVAADKPAILADPTLARWVRSIWHTKRIQRLELHHLSTGGRDHVQTWAQTDISGKDVDLVMQEVWDAAGHDAQSFKGPQGYAIFVFEEARQQPMRRMFKMQGTEWVDDGETETEPANAKGHLGQLMRHNEAYARLAIGGARESQGVLKSMLSEVLQQNREMAGIHLRVMETFKDLQDRTFERDMDREDKKTVREIKQMVAGEAVKLMPILLTKFATSKDEKRGAEDQIRMLLMQFAGSLNAEQMQGILSPLTEQQRITFMELYQQLQAQHVQSAEGQAQAQAEAEAKAAAQAEAEAKEREQAEEASQHAIYAAIRAQAEAAALGASAAAATLPAAAAVSPPSPPSPPPADGAGGQNDPPVASLPETQPIIDGEIEP